MLILLFMKLLDTLNPKEWSSIRRINGSSRLKGKRAGYLENYTSRNKGLSGRSRKKLPRTWRLTQILLARSWKSSSIEVWWALHGTEWESFYSETAFVSDSGHAGQGEFLERCTRILWSWNSEQLWNVPRSSQPTNIPSPGGMISLLLASLYTELFGNLRKRIWKSTCSIRAILSILAKPKEFGIIFLRIKPIDTGTIAEQIKELRRTAGLYNTNSSICQESRNLESSLSHWRNLLSKLYDGKSEKSELVPAFRLIPWPRRLPVLEGQFQDWSILSLRMSYNRHVMDQRSGDSQISGRSFDVAVNWRAWFQSLWNAWCDKGLLDWRGSSLISTSEESQCPKSSLLKNTTVFFTNKTDYFHDLWPFSRNWSLWCSSRPIRPFKVSLHGDDIQDFETRWDPASLSASETPKENILEGLYKLKIRDSVQLQSVLALYEQETTRNNEQLWYSRVKTS